VRHELIRALGGRIQGNGMIGSLMHGERHPCVGAVNRASRGVHQVPDRVVTATLEDVKSPRHVAVDVGLRGFE